MLNKYEQFLDADDNNIFRADMTKKGKGFLGELQRPDGRVSTEISIGVEIDGRETEIPTLVPTLNKEEVDYLLGGNEPTQEIADKARRHAIDRMVEGKSPFREDEESDKYERFLDDEPFDLEESITGEPPEVKEPKMAGLPKGAGRPISAITGKPEPTEEERFAGAEAVLNLIPYAFASTVRGVVPEALETAIMQPLTKTITGRDYVSPITEAQRVSGAKLPEPTRQIIGTPFEMAGAVAPLTASFKTADAALKTIGLSAKAIEGTPLLTQLSYNLIKGGIAGGVYGGIEEGTPKGIGRDAALFAALQGVFGTAAPLIDKISKSNWYRKLSIKERGLVTEKIAKNYREGMTEGEVLRFLGKESKAYKEAMAMREVKPTPEQALRAKLRKAEKPIEKVAPVKTPEPIESAYDRAQKIKIEKAKVTPKKAEAVKEPVIPTIEKALKKRGIKGDELLNTIERIDEAKSYDKTIEIDNNGYVTLYHRTNKINAENIKNTGYMTTKEPGLFFGSKPEGQIEGYGESVVKVKIPIEKLELNDIFTNEVHFNYPEAIPGKKYKVEVLTPPAKPQPTAIPTEAKPETVKPTIEVKAMPEVAPKEIWELTLEDFKEIKKEITDKVKAKEFYDEISKILKPKTLKPIKPLIHKAVGITKAKDGVLIDTAQAFKESLRRAARAFKEGNRAGVEKEKLKIKELKIKYEERVKKIKTTKEILQRRRSKIRAVRDYFKLSDADMRKITRKDIRLMSNFEFKQHLDNIRKMAEKFDIRRQAMNELMTQVRDKELNVENLRKAMKLPTLKNMKVEQIKKLDAELEPFQKGDEFLSVRKLEVVDRTELEGIKTWREAREHLAKEISKQEGRTVSVEELQNIKVSEFDRFRYDTGLAEKDPFYRMMVEKPAARMLVSEAQYLEMEKETFALAKKIKGKGFIGWAVPQHKKIVRFMETPADKKAEIKLTEEEMALTKYMVEKNLISMDYLIQIEAMKMGRQNYYHHVRRGILEAVKEDGIIKAVKEQFESYKLDEQGFNILDRETGEILAYDKWFGPAMHRTGKLKPTENVVKAFLSYQKMFLKKQALDETTVLIDIYAHALTPKGMTKKGLLLHGNLIKFVKEWINTQKGRHVTLIAKQNGKIDAALRAIKMFTSLRDLGLNIPVSVATEIGEQVTTYQLLGKKKFALGKWRQNTKQGKAIIEKYRSLVGKNPWKELVEPSKAIGNRLMEGIFVLFRDASERSNRTFLLGALSKKEFRAGEINPERLAALRTELGRYRMVQGMKSIIGATPEGRAYTQYKKWAIPILRTTIKNLGNIGKKIAFQKPDSKEFKRSALELYRLVEITAFAMLMFGMVRDEDDNSFTGKMINKAYREATTLIQALQPRMFLAAGRTAAFIEELGVNLTLLLLGEKYKTTDEYKGIKKLKKQFKPVAVSQFQSKEKTKSTRTTRKRTTRKRREG